MAAPPTRSGLHRHLLLLGRFLRNPRTVGAIAPSSRELANQMVDGLDLGGAARIVELGPGTGAFTGAIVERIGPAGRFVAIDIEPAFVRQIQQQWPSVECVLASAEALPALLAERGLVPVDHIISGLPFASLPSATTRQILDGIERTLRPGGTFTTFQYVHAYRLPAAKAFRHDMSARMGGPVQKRLVILNVPPAWVLRWSHGAHP